MLNTMYHIINVLIPLVSFILMIIALVKRHKNNVFFSLCPSDYQDKAISQMVDIIYERKMFFFKLVGIGFMIFGAVLSIYFAVVYFDGTMKAFFDGLTRAVSSTYIPRTYDYPEYEVFKAFPLINIGFFIMMVRSIVYNRKMKEFYERTTGLKVL